MSNSRLYWQCFGKSVQGVSHVRANLPNQDAIAWFPDEESSSGSTPIIVAVSDGHGSRKNFRSDQGSQIAVSTAIRVIRREICSPQKDNPLLAREQTDQKMLMDLVNNHLPRKLVHEWELAVQEHWEQHPLQLEESRIWAEVKAELRRSQGKEVPDPQKKPEEPTIIPYGATLLTVLVTNFFILYLQLGDGDILCVDSNNRVTRPLSRDDRLIANETTSLCTSNAWRDFRVALHFHDPNLPAQIPALILLSTDGYANSFSSEADFQKIGSDYRDMVQSEGLKGIGLKLDGYLRDASEQGSGDDITLGIIKRLENEDHDYGSVMTIQLKEQHQKLEQKVKRIEALSKEMRLLSLRSNITAIVAITVAIASLASCLGLFYRTASLDQAVKKAQGELVQFRSELGKVGSPAQAAPAPLTPPDQTVPNQSETTQPETN